MSVLPFIEDCAALPGLKCMLKSLSSSPEILKVNSGSLITTFYITDCIHRVL